MSESTRHPSQDPRDRLAALAPHLTEAQCWVVIGFLAQLDPEMVREGLRSAGVPLAEFQRHTCLTLNAAS